MKRFYRLNQSIRSSTVRLVGPGVNELVSLDEALRRARFQDEDLVEVSENTEPPVVRIIEFKKFLFEEKKKEKKGKKSGGNLKELRFSPAIATNDLKIRVARAKEFLKQGNPVKLTVRFRGREVTHPEIGSRKLDEVVSLLAGYGKKASEPKWFGSMLSLTFSPAAPKEK